MEGPVRAGWGARVSARLADYPPLHGVVVSLAAASVGLVVVEFVVLLVWTADTRSVAAASSALQVGADVWLLAHGSTLELPQGRLEVLPFGLALLPVLLAASAGRRLALARLAGPADPTDLDGSPRQRWNAGGGGSVRGRRFGSAGSSASAGAGAARPRRRTVMPPGNAATWRTTLFDVTAATVPYVVLVCVVALVASDASAKPTVVPAALTTFLLAGAGATAGVMRGGGGALLAWRSLPQAGRDLLAAGAAGAAAVVAVASVMFVVLLAARFPEVAAATRDLDTDLDIGLVGGAALFVGQAVLLPNVVVWTAAYSLGPGTATGGGGVLRPAQADPSQLPDLPLFAAIPTTALPTSAWFVLALVPAVAGVVIAVFTCRSRRTERLGAQLARATVSTMVCALVLGVCAHLSGASVGVSRIGPAGEWTGLAAAGEVVAATVVALIVARLVSRRQRSAAVAAESEGVPVPSGATRVTRVTRVTRRTEPSRPSEPSKRRSASAGVSAARPQV